MKRTLCQLLLPAALAAALGLAGARPIAAGNTGPQVVWFEDSFSISNGFVTHDIWVSGYLQLRGVFAGSAPLLPPSPIRIYVTLANARAENLTTGETYAGGGVTAFDTEAGSTTSPIASFSLVAAPFLPPSPIKLLRLVVQFTDLTVDLNGNLTFSGITALDQLPE